ncbi:MAG: DNA polymerase IV [Calditrichaceae bacterium]|nr:DNA polymerase IV [Calditrichaceae bacterium]
MQTGKFQRLILHIDADAFFASVEQGFNPLLRGKPVIVGGRENQRGVVHTASYEARACGIYTGMALGQVRSQCPEAVFLKGNYEHYRAVSRVFQEVYLRYTPAVEFTSLDDAYLDMTGAQHLYPSPEWVAKAITTEVFAKTGVGLSVGIGSSKLIARIASGLKKPRGMVHVPAGEERSFLAGLPVDVLPGIGRGAKDKLTDLHIFKVKELAALPRIVLEQLFGKNGVKLWELANGYDERPVQRRIIPGQISRETSFEEDTGDITIIKGALQYLTERIAKKLREQDLAGRTLSVKIRYSDFRRNAKSRSLNSPTNNGSEMYHQAFQLFEEICLRRIRLRHVGVSISNIEPLNYQSFLFNDKSRQEALNRAVDDIRDRFGFMAMLPADTLELKRKYRMEPHGYILHNPALTR